MKAFISLLTTACVLLTAHGCTQRSPLAGLTENHEILFSAEYTNGFTPYQPLRRGFYVDGSGRVYTYESGLHDAPWVLSENGSYTEKELLELFTRSRVFKGRIAADVLYQQCCLIGPSATGSLRERPTTSYDRGITGVYAYILDNQSHRYRRVTLRLLGDQDVENIAPEAKLLHAWLLDIARAHKIDWLVGAS